MEDIIWCVYIMSHYLNIIICTLSDESPLLHWNSIQDPVLLFYVCVKKEFSWYTSWPQMCTYLVMVSCVYYYAAYTHQYNNRRNPSNLLVMHVQLKNYRLDRYNNQWPVKLDGGVFIYSHWDELEAHVQEIHPHLCMPGKPAKKQGVRTKLRPLTLHQ